MACINTKDGRRRVATSLTRADGRTRKKRLCFIMLIFVNVASFCCPVYVEKEYIIDSKKF